MDQLCGTVQQVKYMELIELKPSSLSLIFPHHLRAETSLLNLTLHQVVVRVICSNPDNFIIQHPIIKIGSFEQAKLVVKVKFYQEALLSNYLGNKIMLYCYDEDQDGELWNDDGLEPDKLKRLTKMELQLNCTADMEKYTICQPKTKQLMLKVHRYAGTMPLQTADKHCLITFLETLGDLKCLHSLPDGDFLAQYRSMPQNNVSLIHQMPISNNRIAIYSISTVPIIMKEKLQPREATPPAKKETSIIPPASPQKPVEIQKPKSKQPEGSAVERKNPSQQKHKQVKFEQQSISPPPVRQRRPHHDITTVTFIGENSIKGTFARGRSKKRRKNKSVEEERNIYEEEEEQDQSKYFVKSKIQDLIPSEIRRLKDKVKEAQENNLSEQKKLPKFENIQIINCVMEPLGLLATQQSYFILFNEFVVQYENSDKVTPGKKIMIGNNPFQKSYKDKKLTIKYKSGFLIISCDYTFCVITLETDAVSWVNVQRKEIYDFAIMIQKNLIAIGGKNFSKFSLFGKTTSRSNIKLYRLKDVNDHLFTYDIDNAGIILQLQEVNIGNTKVLIMLGQADKLQTFYLMNVVSDTKIQIFGRFGLKEDLAILSVKSLCVIGNRDIFGLETLPIENRELMIVKKFHIKLLNEWKCSIATQTCSIKQNTFSFFQSDNRSFILYSCTDQELTLYDNATKAVHVFKLAPGFHSLRYANPYIFLVFDSYIEVKKLVF